MEVSEIGLGGHQEGVETGRGLTMNARFFRTAEERARVVGRAIDEGVTYFDTTFGCEIASLGHVLHQLGARDRCFVSAMAVDFFANLKRDSVGSVREQVRHEVNTRLRESGFETLDQFTLGAVESGDPLATPEIIEEALDELALLRSEGKVRFTGISCHTPDYAARFLLAFPTVDAVMTPYNFTNREAEGALAAALQRTSAAWIVMKPLVWRLYGMPVTVLRHLKASPVDGPWLFGRPSELPIAQLALRFILQHPWVTTCVPAMADVAQVEENVAASGRGALDADDLTQLEALALAMRASNGIPLAIGGLQVDNLRVRHYALALLARELGPEMGLGPYTFDYAAHGVETAVAQAAAAALEVLAQHEVWRPLIVPED